MGRYVQPEINDHLCERENQNPEPRGTEMSKAAGQPSTNNLSSVVDLLVEERIKLDALEHILKETNPLLHEFYLGTVENLRAQEGAELKKVFTVRLSQSLGKAKRERGSSRRMPAGVRASTSVSS